MNKLWVYDVLLVVGFIGRRFYWKLVIGSAYKLVGCAGQWQEASPSFLQTCWLMYTCVVHFIPTTFPIFPLSADCYRKIQNEESVVLFLVVWTVTEITRYSFYTFSLLNHLPYFIKWARCRGDVDEWAHLIGRLFCFCWLASRSDWRTEALTLKWGGESHILVNKYLVINQGKPKSNPWG